MRVYIAGPMRGLPHLNFPAFHAAASQWRATGWDVYDPALDDEVSDGFDPDRDEPQTTEHYMRRDLPQVATSDAIALLPGWEQSEGVHRELTVASFCGLPVYDAITMDEVGRPSQGLRFVEPDKGHVSAEYVIYLD